MVIDSDYIRKHAKNAYVQPAMTRNETLIAIPVKAVEADLKKIGFPSGRTPMVCSALRGRKFQRENGLVLDHWDGPAKGQSTTVVFYYRSGGDDSGRNALGEAARPETPAEKAHRLTEKLRGLLKDELAEYGGGEAFLKWIRSEDEDEVA